MKKKLFLLIIISISSATTIFSKNKSDSIYQDLCSFLIQTGNMSEEIGCEYFERFLYIFEVISHEEAPDFINRPFGVYKFNYIGCEDCGYYVLIKYNEDYTIFYQKSIGLMIKELLKIKESNPEFMDCNAFEAYIQAIANDGEGLDSEQIDISQKFGRLNYIQNF